VLTRPLRLTQCGDATEGVGARLSASLGWGHAQNALGRRRGGAVSVRFLPSEHRDDLVLGDWPVWEAVIRPEKISCRRRLQDTTNMLRST
jgi:hypothetical protein